MTDLEDRLERIELQIKLILDWATIETRAAIFARVQELEFTQAFIKASTNPNVHEDSDSNGS